MIKRLLAALCLALVMVAATAALPVETQPQPANAAWSDKFDGECTGNETEGRCADKPLLFDHSQCQYPDRTTNPPNGCDNTDPCDPANVKGGSGDCAPAASITPEVPVNTNQCGGGK